MHVWSPGLETGGGHGNPLQHSSLGTSMHRETWWATVMGWDTTEATELT